MKKPTCQQNYKNGMKEMGSVLDIDPVTKSGQLGFEK